MADAGEAPPAKNIPKKTKEELVDALEARQEWNERQLSESCGKQVVSCRPTVPCFTFGPGRGGPRGASLRRAIDRGTEIGFVSRDARSVPGPAAYEVSPLPYTPSLVTDGWTLEPRFSFQGRGPGRKIRPGPLTPARPSANVEEDVEAGGDVEPQIGGMDAAPQKASSLRSMQAPSAEQTRAVMMAVAESTERYRTALAAPSQRSPRVRQSEKGGLAVPLCPSPIKKAPCWTFAASGRGDRMQDGEPVYLWERSFGNRGKLNKSSVRG